MTDSIYNEAIGAGLPPHAARHAIYIETLDGVDRARAYIHLASEAGPAHATAVFDQPARTCRGTNRPRRGYAVRSAALPGSAPQESTKPPRVPVAEPRRAPSTRRNPEAVRLLLSARRQVRAFRSVVGTWPSLSSLCRPGLAAGNR